jgi:hypothetical protein
VQALDFAVKLNAIDSWAWFKDDHGVGMIRRCLSLNHFAI